jgi:hypothetical protein
MLSCNDMRNFQNVDLLKKIKGPKEQKTDCVASLLLGSKRKKWNYQKKLS